MKKTLITLIALAGMAHADFVWNGGEEALPRSFWQNRIQLVHHRFRFLAVGRNRSRGTPNSDAWSLISVSGANGSISQLEGWTLKLALQNGADLTVGNVKKIPGRLFY